MIWNTDRADTVRTADRVKPLYVAEMMADPDPDELMITSKAPVELFAGTVIEGGNAAMEVLLLESVTTAPPVDVGAVK